MATRLTGRLSLLLLAFAVVMLIFPAMAFAQGAPTIQSDLPDYAPGDTVNLTGSNWQPDEAVHINVNDDQGQTWNRDVDVTADASGNITDQFQLPSWFVATYKVTATGPTSGTATTTFTDGNKRFRTQSLSGSGNVQFSVTSYTRYTGNNSCQGNGTTVTLTPNGTVTQNLGSGSFQVDVPAGQSIKLTAPSPEDGQDFVDWTGPADTFTTSGPNNQTICVIGSNSADDYTANYTTDLTAPKVVSINRSGTSPTNTTNPVNWTVTFSESVTGVDASDFSLQNSGLGGTPTITGVSGSGTTRTVTASTGSGDGTLGLNLVDNDTIVDASRNKLVGTGTNADGSFTGEAYTIDRTAPTITAVVPTENANNVAVGTNVEATFSEDMNASTITGGSGGTFQLRQGTSTGTIVSASQPTYNAATKTATLDPSANLLNNQQYTAILTNGVRDLPGNAIAAKTWSFTTAPACTNPSDPTFSGTPDGNNGWYKTVPAVSASSSTSAAVVKYSDAQNGTYSTTAPTLGQGTTTVWAKAFSSTGSCSSQAVSRTYKVDTDAPAISGADVNNTTWRNSDLSESFTASDSGSGLATSTDASFTLTASLESTKDANGNVVPTKVSKTVTDQAGNSTTRSLSAKIDKTSPVISGADFVNSGWTNQDISKTFAANDSLSGLAEADKSFDITASEESTKDAQGNVIPTKVEKTVKDLAGNVSNTRSVSAQIDKTAPVVDGPDFVNSGWTNQDVSKTFAANDALSGLAESQKSLTLTASAESTKDAQGNVIPTEVSGKVTDLAGNESLPRKLSAKIDRTNPVISGADINDTTWRNTDRSAGFTASDGLSGLSVATDSSFTLTASAESTKDSSGNVVPTQVSRTVTDQAGNSAKRSLSAKIDKTSPSVSASVSPNAAPSGWYNKATGAPTVRYQCSDALSGLSGTCPADHIFGEGANQSHSSGDVYDQAGNKASASVDNIDVDLTAPTKPQAGFGRAPEDSTGGYFKDEVTVSYSGSTDSGGSGLKSISSSQIFNTTGAHNYSGVAEDNAGNVSDAASGTVKVDASVPDVQPGDVVDSTWRNGSLSKSFKATDTGSGLNASGLAADGSLTFNLEASAESQAPDKPTIVQRTISDKVGHSVTRSVSALIDLTRPNISASTTKDPAPSGWYNLDTGAPVVHFECSDLLSGIAALSCPADHTITTEGTNQGYSDSVPDRAGNTNSAGVSGLKIDLTRPAAAGAPDLLVSSDSGDPNDNQTNVRTPTFDVNAETGSTVKLYGQKDGAATAALLGSGPATNGLATITSAQALSDGTYTFHATVTDQAGNVSSTQDIKVTIVTIDASAPTFSNVPSDQIVEATSAQGAPVTYTKPSADDSVDGPVAVDCQPASGTVFALGATTVNCSATDKAGNKASASFKVTVQDTNAPKNEALSGPSGWIKENSASFNWSFSDIVTNTADLQYSYRLDGTEVDWSPYSSTTSKSLSGLSEGSHTFFVRAKDAAGNVAIAQQSFGVDTIAPAITPGDDLSDGTWYSSAQQRSFAATDGGSGLDARAGLSANGGFTLSVSTEPTTKDANGNYVPVVDSYTVFDKAGNSTTRRFSALIDLGNPLLGITDNNVASYNVCQGAPSKPGFNPSDALSGLDLAKTKDSWTSNLQPSGVGSYTYSAQAYDLAGRSATYGPKTYNVVYGAAFGGVLQPINADGSSRFKLGSTVPVKFKLMCGTTPIDNAVAKLNVKKFDSTPDAGVDEVISTAASTTGNLFRYDAMSGQYIFNLSTKSGYTQTVNGVTQTVSFAQGTYTLSIILDDGTYRNVNIQIVR